MSATINIPSISPAVPFDASFVPTLCVLIAAYYTVYGVSALKFYSNAAHILFLWGLLFFSLCYSNALSTRVISDATYATIDKMVGGTYTIPLATTPASTLTVNAPNLFSVLNVAYQGALAVYASTLVLQGGAGKLNYFCSLIFLALWTLFVYVPLTNWQSAVQAFVWLIPGTNNSTTNPGIGWLSANSGNWGLLDHAGAHHVSMAAGASTLALSFLLGKASTPVEISKDFSVALWYFFGMAGYLTMGDPNSLSGGSAPALLNVFMCVSVAVLTAVVYQVLYHLTKGHGICAPRDETIITAMHYGLVGISAGASLVSPMWATFFGFFTVSFCYLFNYIFEILALEGVGVNSIFSIHFLGGAVSSALTGCFANPSYGANGSAAITTFAASIVAAAKAAGVTSTIAIPEAIKTLATSTAVSAGSFYGNTIQLGRQCAGVSITFLEASIATTITYAFLLLVSKAFGNPTFTLLADDEPTAEEKAAATGAQTA